VVSRSRTALASPLPIAAIVAALQADLVRLKSDFSPEAEILATTGLKLAAALQYMLRALTYFTSRFGLANVIKHLPRFDGAGRVLGKVAGVMGANGFRADGPQLVLERYGRACIFHDRFWSVPVLLFH
jgi:hypothetical protein